MKCIITGQRRLGYIEIQDSNPVVFFLLKNSFFNETNLIFNVYIAWDQDVVAYSKTIWQPAEAL